MERMNQAPAAPLGRGKPARVGLVDVAPGGERLPPASARALLVWPGLDRVRLRRTHGDPVRIARLVSHRTVLSPEEVLALLLRPAQAST